VATANTLTPAAASLLDNVAIMPTSDNSNGPCTLNARQPLTAFTPSATHPASHTIESSSDVRVIEKNLPADAHAGIAVPASSRTIANLSGSTDNLNLRDALLTGQRIATAGSAPTRHPPQSTSHSHSSRALTLETPPRLQTPLPSRFFQREFLAPNSQIPLLV